MLALLMAGVYAQTEDIDAYLAEQTAITDLDLRECSEPNGKSESGITQVDNGEGGLVDKADTRRARLRVPKSGWALKKFPGVKAWVNANKDTYDPTELIVERNEP